MQNKKQESMETLFTALWLELSRSGLPIHSFLMDWKSAAVKEAYLAPYGKSDLHRMFSITKSLCSIAIGFVLEDKKISLEDPIVDYFPEHCPPNPPDWLTEMTIRHLLVMETCHSSTTYKIDYKKNWVESFFITPPTHRSGQIFLYDTSASHTLAALIKKLTGLEVLEYLRKKCLDSIGFSKEAFILKDPFAAEMGGSGLMALPSDLLKLGRFCMDTIKNGKGIFADYLREAVSFQVPTIHFGQTLDEQQGYGYQFWRIRNGFAMYGMGGQYVLFYPEPDLVFVVTADTQNIKGGNQKILDIIGDKAASLIKTYRQSSTLKQALPAIPERSLAYRISAGNSRFRKLTLRYDVCKGILTLYETDRLFTFPFSFEKSEISVLQGYNEKMAIRAMWADADSLYLPVQIIGEQVGSVHIMLRLSEKKATVWMKRVIESSFHEFQGFLEGVEE